MLLEISSNVLSAYTGSLQIGITLIVHFMAANVVI